MYIFKMNQFNLVHKLNPLGFVHSISTQIKYQLYIQTKLPNNDFNLIRIQIELQQFNKNFSAFIMHSK